VTQANKPHVSHILACIVYEPVDCTVDLVRNLNRLAPESLVALYVDQRYLDVYAQQWPSEGVRSALIPGTRPVPMPGLLPVLHGVYFDILRWADSEFVFDALTIVDSDQLLVSPGFARRILSFLDEHPSVGLLGSAHVHERQGPDSRYYQARKAHEEIRVWYPFLAQFDAWQSSFVHYSFWPSLAVAGRAVKGVLECVDSMPSLRSLLQQTKISALNEVLVPTIVRLLGWGLAPSPASFRYTRWRKPLSFPELRAAMADHNCYWIHPVTRDYDDPVRTFIRRTVGY
jgi:hypothetical protein